MRFASKRFELLESEELHSFATTALQFETSIRQHQGVMLEIESLTYELEFDVEGPQQYSTDWEAKR